MGTDEVTFEQVPDIMTEIRRKRSAELSNFSEVILQY